jgi:hypothetical protein
MVVALERAFVNRRDRWIRETHRIIQVKSTYFRLVVLCPCEYFNSVLLLWQSLMKGGGWSLVALLYEQRCSQTKKPFIERGNNQTKGRNNQKSLSAPLQDPQTTTIVSVFL